MHNPSNQNNHLQNVSSQTTKKLPTSKILKRVAGILAAIGGVVGIVMTTGQSGIQSHANQTQTVNGSNSGVMQNGTTNNGNMANGNGNTQVNIKTDSIQVDNRQDRSVNINGDDNSNNSVITGDNNIVPAKR